MVVVVKGSPTIVIGLHSCSNLLTFARNIPVDKSFHLMAKQLPSSFAERIRSTHSDADEFLSAIDSDPFLSLRLNPGKWKPGFLTLGEPVPWCADGYYLSDRPQFTLNPAFHAGAFYVQEASSMSYSVALDFVKDKLPASPTCLDLCAAPGGKTTLLLSCFGQKGVVVANEPMRQRAWILRENVAKWGCASAIVTNLFAKDITASGASFDLIQVDAPCSGEGMFRKDDVAVAEWSPKAAADCAERQREILQDIWPALKPGGFMIYSTCTFNPDENELNIQWAAENLEAEILTLPMPEGVGITTIKIGDGEGYAFYPHKVCGEGFFVCLLRKSESAVDIPVSKPRNKKKGAPVESYKEVSTGRQYVRGARVYAKGGELCAFPADRAVRMAALADGMSPLMAGAPVGSILVKKGSEVLTPAPELPLSQIFESSSMPVFEVDLQTALKFLHGDSDLALPGGDEGWSAVAYEGLPLGLVKRIGARMNNYYPKEWRIRMSVE